MKFSLPPGGGGDLLASHLASRLAQLPPGAICVGFSGGLDSTVLLDALHRVGRRETTAVHVHHGLSPNAGDWQEFNMKLLHTLREVDCEVSIRAHLASLIRQLRFSTA